MENTQRLLTTPGMLLAYSNWITSHIVFQRSPVVSYTTNIQISEWLNFSEYWSFRQGIPANEVVFMKQCLHDSSSDKPIAIDIGSNIGIFALTLADLGYEEVHVFEPIPQTFKRLQRNVLNSKFEENIKLNLIAIGLEESLLEFEVFEDAPAINRLIHSNRELSRGGHVQPVAVISLDSYCDRNKINKIDFLKIDVEGMEPSVIQGASTLLSNQSVSSILLEICPANLHLAGSSVEKVYQLMVNFNYYPYELNHNGEIGSLLKITELQEMILSNVVFKPKL